MIVFLSPYCGELYHSHDYRGQRTSQGPKELFNCTQSSLRNVIEMCFGVLKAHLHIIKSMLSYALKKQKYISLACCVFHNFIKMEMQDGHLFRQEENVEVEVEELDGNNMIQQQIHPLS